jgi:hypothetical protein
MTLKEALIIATKAGYSLTESSRKDILMKKYLNYTITEEEGLELKRLVSEEAPKQKQHKARKCVKVGTCVQVGRNEDLPWDDATEMAQDLGYYATFDKDESPAYSNYKEIDVNEFARNCEYILPKQHFIYLKHKKDPIYIAYNKDTDIHTIYC